MPQVLTRRELNRATLDRQLLLRRSPMTTVEALERLVGLQSQTPQTWYVGLWTRLEHFDPVELSDYLRDRDVVRISMMRATIHLVTTRDCLAYRHLFDIVAERTMKGAFGKNLAGLDLDEVVKTGRALLDEEPLTFSELGARLAERWPDRDRASLAQVLRGLAPLVQVTPRGLWQTSGKAAHTTAEHWLGRPLDSDGTIDELVLRYLAAFGPASVKDMQTWSGLTRLNEVFARLGGQLMTFTGEDGRELFDLPDAPRPDGDSPAPARFLYDFDNLLLSHADRSRFFTAEYAVQEYPDNYQPRLIFLDGLPYGSWSTTRTRSHATLTIRPFRPYTDDEQSTLHQEGTALLTFCEPKATTHTIDFLPLHP